MLIRLTTIAYEIASKNEIYMFLSESLYLMIKDNRFTENNRYLIFSAIIGGKNLIALILEVLSRKKLRHARAVYIASLKVVFIYMAAKMLSRLPLAADRLMAHFPKLFGGARLYTYLPDQSRAVNMILTKGITVFWWMALLYTLLALGLYRLIYAIFVKAQASKNNEEIEEISLARKLIMKFVFSKVCLTSHERLQPELLQFHRNFL